MNHDTDRPILDLSLSLGDYDQANWDATADQLRPFFRVGGGLSIELSEAELIPHIVCQITAFSSAVGIGLLTNALWDALKHLLNPREESTPVRIEIVLKIEDSRQVYRQITTDDPEALRQGLEEVAEDATSALEENEDE
jgi:hypothetical protein